MVLDSLSADGYTFWDYVAAGSKKSPHILFGAQLIIIIGELSLPSAPSLEQFTALLGRSIFQSLTQNGYFVDHHRYSVSIIVYWCPGADFSCHFYLF